MNSTPSHLTKHHDHSCDGSPRRDSSTAPAASIEVLKDKISTLDALSVQTASQCSYPSTALSSSTSVANANAVEGSDMQTRRILPTNCENCKPGTTLDPASCASVLALIGGGGEDRSLSTALSKSTNAADTNAGSRERTDTEMQTLLIPTKSENSEPGPTLNPASCASGLALIGGGFGGGEGNDWNSASYASGLALIDGIGGEGDDRKPDPALSLTTLVERINNSVQDQGNTHRRNSLLQNEDWGELHHPQGQGNLFLGNGGN